MEMDSLEDLGPNFRSLVFFPFLGNVTARFEMKICIFWIFENFRIQAQHPCPSGRWSCWSFTAFGDFFAAESLPEISEKQNNKEENMFFLILHLLLQQSIMIQLFFQ